MSVREPLESALRHHLRAKAHIAHAEDDVRRQRADNAWERAAYEPLRRLVDNAARAAERAAPGWLSRPWPAAEDAAIDVTDHAGEDPAPAIELADLASAVVPVRIGRAAPQVGGGFPALVPLLGAGHLLINDRTAGGEAQASLVSSVVLRLAAGTPAASLRVLPVDAAARGLTFAPFKAMIDGGLMTPPAPDLAGFRRVLEQAEKQTDTAVRQGHADNLPYLIVAISSFPHMETRAELVRLAQLAKAGPRGRVHLVVAGYPPITSANREPAPLLESVTQISITDDRIEVAGPRGETFFGRSAHAEDGSLRRGDDHCAIPIAVEPGPSDALIEALTAHVGTRAHAASQLGLSTILPDTWWQESSAKGLTTTLGLEGALPAQLTFDDQTPHWLVGGPTGSGKTVFLIDLLYGLACRYSPEELHLYLLDFKEGVSFTEFTPRAHEPECRTDCTLHDPTWIPHARVVGVESDRQYGVAVLRSLVAEMTKRANDMKRVGVQNLASLRAQRPGTPYPRIVAVIDEFQHLFAGNDALTTQAVALLEELARKGRSYGIHLVLASQTAAGIQALYDKKESIFGQFGMRIALRGSRTVLDPENFHDDNLPLGSMVVNAAAGHKDANRVVQFPDATADPDKLRDIRQRLWAQRTDDTPPAVFAGYARQRLDDDPAYRAATPETTRPVAMVGRFVDVGLPTAGFPLDPTVGRHVAVLGTKSECAHILNAAVVSLGAQHTPESARFVLAPFVHPEIAEDARRRLEEHGHRAETVDLVAFRHIVGELAATPVMSPTRTYLAGYGIDVVNAALDTIDELGNNAGDQLRQIFRDGPGRGVHVLGWWRGYSRFTSTVAGQFGVGAHNDVACVVAVNTPASELSPYFGGMPPAWTPSDNRAYFIDTGETKTGIIVPFTPADHD